ncbi:hypothetical protein [Paraglaciecola aestuariivivens]
MNTVTLIIFGLGFIIVVIYIPIQAWYNYGQLKDALPQSIYTEDNWKTFDLSKTNTYNYYPIEECIADSNDYFGMCDGYLDFVPKDFDFNKYDETFNWNGDEITVELSKSFIELDKIIPVEMTFEFTKNQCDDNESDSQIDLILTKQFQRDELSISFSDQRIKNYQCVYRSARAIKREVNPNDFYRFRVKDN